MNDKGKNHKKKTQSWLLKFIPGDFLEVITQNNVKKSNCSHN